MALWKVAKFAAIGVGLLVVASAVLSAVAALVGLVWAILTTVATIAALAAVGYVGFKVATWLMSDGASAREPASNFEFGGSNTATTTTESPEEKVDRLQEQYADGDLTEAEFERRVELALHEDEPDSIDRELERERT